MKERGEEELQFHLCYLVSKTHSLSCTKWHEVFGFMKFSLWCQESFWSELFRLIPDLWVHVNSVQQGNDVSVLGDDVSIKLNSSEQKMLENVAINKQTFFQTDLSVACVVPMGTTVDLLMTSKRVALV